MDNKEMSHTQDETISNLTSKELQEIALDPENLKAMEAVIKDNPKFKDITFFIQLKDNDEFQQALKEYMSKNLSKPPKLEVVKSILPKNHVKPNNKLVTACLKNKRECAI